MSVEFFEKQEKIREVLSQKKRKVTAEIEVLCRILSQENFQISQNNLKFDEFRGGFVYDESLHMIDSFTAEITIKANYSFKLDPTNEIVEEVESSDQEIARIVKKDVGGD